jgi:hypothetical protein
MMAELSYYGGDVSTYNRGGKAMRSLPLVLTDAAMQSRWLLFHDYARECEKKAEAVDDPALKSLYRDLSSQWRELAAIARNLSFDKKQVQQFYGTRSSGQGSSR